MKGLSEGSRPSELFSVILKQNKTTCFDQADKIFYFFAGHILPLH
jgi:hypothetical protein